MSISYNKLWKLLIDKDMTKTELRKKAGVTTNVIAKMGKHESIQLETLYKICKVLDCSIDDISEVIDDGEESDSDEVKFRVSSSLLACPGRNRSDCRRLSIY